MYRTFRIIVLAVLLLALLVLVPSPKFVFAEIVEYDQYNINDRCIAPHQDCYLDEWHYEDPSISVSIEKGRMFDTNYMVVRVKIANATHLLDAPQMRKVLVQTYLAADAVLKAYTTED